MVTCPLVEAVIVMEHVPWDRAHVVEAKETEPVPLWDQLTVPVGTYPVTLALQVMLFDEATGTLAGLQETVVFEAFVIAVRATVPVKGGSEGARW